MFHAQQTIVAVIFSTSIVRVGIASPFLTGDVVPGGYDGIGILQGKRDSAFAGSYLDDSQDDLLETADFGSDSGDTQVLDTSALGSLDPQTSQFSTLDGLEVDQVVPQLNIVSSSPSDDASPSLETSQDVLIAAEEDCTPDNIGRTSKRSTPPNADLRSCPARGTFQDPNHPGRGSVRNYGPYQPFRSKNVILESDHVPCKGEKRMHVSCGGPRVVMGTAFVYVFNCKFGKGFVLFGGKSCFLGMKANEERK